MQVTFDLSYAPGQELEVLAAESEVVPLRWCPPGEFLMGSPDADEAATAVERPQHPVRLTRGFWIGGVPVTQRLWEQVMGWQLPLAARGPESDALPAEGMGWPDAAAFCGVLTTRLRDRGVLTDGQRIALPTEAQWEYACRAGTPTRWHFGDGAALLPQHAWYEETSGGSTHPVGHKAANPWGLRDLYGNVAEWCRDDFCLYAAVGGAVVDPLCERPEAVLKIVRGGSFAQRARECRSASRATVAADNPYNEPTGLRVVCVAD